MAFAILIFRCVSSMLCFAGPAHAAAASLSYDRTDADKFKGHNMISCEQDHQDCYIGNHTYAHVVVYLQLEDGTRLECVKKSVQVLKTIIVSHDAVIAVLKKHYCTFYDVHARVYPVRKYL